MKEVLMNIDWMSLIQAIWTIVLVPLFTWIGKEIHDWAKAKRIDKYTDILDKNVTKVVKELYQTMVENVKGTEDWTPEMQAKIKEIARTKVLQSLSATAYEILNEANGDLTSWVETLIEAAICDEKAWV